MRVRRASPPAFRRLALLFLIVGSLVACGSDDGGDGETTDSTTSPSTSSQRTSACSKAELEATAEFGSRLHPLIERIAEANQRLGAALGDAARRFPSVDRQEIPNNLRQAERDLNELERELSDLGPPPSSFAEAVELMHRALQEEKNGLTITADGIESERGEQASLGLQQMQRGQDLVYQAVTAVDNAQC